MATADLRLTFGAMFIGCIISVSFSGIGTLQAYHYFRQYRKKDSRLMRSMVLAVCVMDFIHTIFICQGMWHYLVLGWGNLQTLDHLIWTVGVRASIAVTGFITFTVQMFFTHRVWRLSKRNIYLALLVTFMATVRLGSSLATTVEMIRLKHFSLFIKEFRWLFTFGLAFSCVIDVLLTSALCYYLQISRTGYSSMDDIIHRLLMYTISNGLLTTFASMLAMLFAATMPHNFLFLSLHFIIAKCYVNSLLATLNSRDALKKRDDSYPLAVHLSVDGHTQPRFRRHAPHIRSPPVSNAVGRDVLGLSNAESLAEGQTTSVGDVKVHIHVERTIHRSDGEMERAASPDKSPKLSYSSSIDGKDGDALSVPRLA